MSKLTQEELARKIREVEAAGYEVRRNVEYVKTGFQIEKTLLERLRRCTDKCKIKMKDAINDAISHWLDHCEGKNGDAPGLLNNDNKK